MKPGQKGQSPEMKPIRRFPGGSGGAVSSRIASNTTLNCASYRFSRAASLRARSAFDDRGNEGQAFSL